MCATYIQIVQEKIYSECDSDSDKEREGGEQEGVQMSEREQMWPIITGRRGHGLLLCCFISYVFISLLLDHHIFSLI